MLAAFNPHPRDSRIVFRAEGHQYLLDGVQMRRSVSGVVHSCFPQFDSEATIAKYFDSWKADPASKYHQLIRYLALVEKQDDEGQRRAIASLWKAGGDEASEAGTALHAQIESYLNDESDDGSGERQKVDFQQFLAFKEDFGRGRPVRPYRTEWSVYDEEAGVAGQIDSLWETEDGSLLMVDWKRCSPAGKKPSDPLQTLGPDVPSFRGERGLGLCAELPNTKFFHYCVQQNLYKFIVERHYGLRIDRMFLAQFHPLLESYHSVEVPDMQDIARGLMAAQQAETRSAAKRPRGEYGTYAGQEACGAANECT